MKKQILVSVILLLSAAFISPAQTFQKSYAAKDGAYATCVRQTFSGGYIIAGYVYDNTTFQYDIYLVNTDANGDTLWTRTLGGGNDDYANSIQQTIDSGFIITGSSDNFGAGSGDVFLIKTDINGNVTWFKLYGDTEYDEGYYVQQTSDSGYIVTGYFGTQGPAASVGGGDNISLLKTDANGDTLWSKIYSTSDDDISYSVQQTNDGGYIITGSTYDTSSFFYDIFLIKTNSTGDTLWSKVFASTDDHEAFAVRQTSDHGYIITGSAMMPNGSTDVELIRTDSSGTIQWTKRYGGNNTDQGIEVDVTNDGGYIITGSSNSFGAANPNVYLIKTDANGDTMWTKTYSDAYTAVGASVKQTADSGYVIAGYTNNTGSGDDGYYFIKTDITGSTGGCYENSTSTVVGNPTLVTSNFTPDIEPGGTLTTATSAIGFAANASSLCIGVHENEINAERTFTISPNPSAGNFKITSDKIFKNGIVQVYSLLGEKVFESKMNNASTKEINLKNVEAGIYFVKVNDGEKIVTGKLIIQ